jgi:hypothetical protein
MSNNELEYLHEIEAFLGKDIEVGSSEEAAIYVAFNEGESVQTTAELLMTSEDHRRLYGTD